jgi:hypothetical protein
LQHKLGDLENVINRGEERDRKEKNMSRKQLTKDCPSCSLLHIDDDSQIICKWGHHKKRKVLDEKHVRKQCTLNRGK